VESVIKLNVPNVISILLIAVIGIFATKWALTMAGQQNIANMI